MKIAACAYQIDWVESFGCYEAKLEGMVADAAGQGAKLLVFPEYGALELAATAGKESAGGVESAMRAVDALWPEIHAAHARLAREHGVHILGASGPCYTGKRPVNRAMFYFPDGRMQAHDKQIMTRYEREVMDVHPGAPMVLMDTEIGRVGVLICYDSEFPLLGRALVEAGAEILLVPSATEALAGYSRVRIGAMARALENQCVAVHSPLQGPAPWNPVVEISTGAAAIYGPPDKGFPETGLVAQGPLDRPGWVYGEVSLDAIREVRRDGNVLNYLHWNEQLERKKPVTIAASA